MLAGTSTPDGYTVNADGAWVHDGSVQTKKVEPIAQPQAQGDLPRTDVYGAYGISEAALDIHSHTRAENAKYGEVKVDDSNYEILVYYANGLRASYYLPNSGMFYKTYGDYPEFVSAEVPKLLFKEDVTGKSEDVAKSLKQKGYDAYENGPVFVRIPDVGMRLEINELDEWGRQFVKFY